MRKHALPVGFLLGLLGATAPSLAAEYFVVRDAQNKCQVVDMRPTDSSVVVIGNRVFASRADAENEMAVACK